MDANPMLDIGSSRLLLRKLIINPILRVANPYCNQSLPAAPEASWAVMRRGDFSLFLSQRDISGQLCSDTQYSSDLLMC